VAATVLKSTTGTWINYATTALFQVLFARSFGATPAASAYALTFTISVGIGAVFVGTSQVVYLPRLLARNGEVLTAIVRRVVRLTWLALATFLILAASATLIAPVLAPSLDRAGVHLAALIRLACLFGFSQVLVGQLAVLCWARGARFVPAVSPAWPSILASVPLLAGADVSTATLYLLLTAGSVLQVILLGITAGRNLSFSREPGDRRGEPPTLVSLSTWAVAQLVVPFEVWVAARASATGGADFNYAYRAIAVAEALIVGGIMSAALPDWSDYFRTEARRTLERSIAHTVSVAALALSVAAGVGLVASQTLVRLAFQRGSFTAHDTRVVSAIIVAGLAGFVAEGVMLVLSQAILAERRIRAGIAFGMGRATALLVLVAIFGLTRGPVGVAMGYSVANVLALAAEIAYVCREGIVTRRQARLARSTLLVTASTGVTAALLVPVDVPSLLRAALVVAVFASGLIRLRDSLPRLRTPLS
jgi:putative peptidoglycan lipid II flippase